MMIVGCGDDSGGAAKSPGLEGTPWQLVSGIEVSGWHSVSPSALFAGGQVSGFDGCNQYTAGYTVNGEALRVQPGASTMMACGEPGESVAGAYADALRRVAKWRIDGAELVLLDAKGAEILRYRVASVAGSWEVTSFLQANAITSPIPGTKITATFADGKLSGSSGCNTYTAKYTTRNGSIAISDIAVAHKVCSEPAGVGEQEQAYLAALPK